MKYSVVIATYNRAADLRETLASLSALRPDGDWEVIVVDNNSTDDTRGVVEGAAGRSRRRSITRRARAGAQPRAERGHPARAGRDHRHDRRRRARGAGLAGSRGGRPRHARLRLRRRTRAADLAGRATRVAAESRRKAMGGDRAPRLRVPSRCSSAPACRSASTWRSGATRSRVPACSIRRPDARRERCSARKCGSGAFARAPQASVACTSRTWPFGTSSRRLG